MEKFAKQISKVSQKVDNKYDNSNRKRMQDRNKEADEEGIQPDLSPTPTPTTSNLRNQTSKSIMEPSYQPKISSMNRYFDDKSSEMKDHDVPAIDSTVESFKTLNLSQSQQDPSSHSLGNTDLTSDQRAMLSAAANTSSIGDNASISTTTGQLITPKVNDRD